MIVIIIGTDLKQEPLDVIHLDIHQQWIATDVVIARHGAIASHTNWPLLRVQRRIREGILRHDTVTIRVVEKGEIRDFHLDEYGDMHDKMPPDLDIPQLTYIEYFTSRPHSPITNR